MEYGFLNELYKVYSPWVRNGRTGLYIGNFIEDLDARDLESLMTRFRALFSGIPYPMLRPYMESFSCMVKKYGAKLRYHSCGSIYPIIPDLIEIGVDILNPVQTLAADMDPFVLKKEFGSQICLCGGLDIQELLPRASAAQVKDYVSKLLDMGKDGGYILTGTHTLQADIPTANIEAVIMACRERD